ncbi:hypothetical protein K435DRAFT_383100 [Dendrothele bispora CBS 962.96]|uniref:Uncharacterized protein n=1 Tax=Dendrothele bispora (strain CBS 962.96) TaxID=1314807 RepID=A0A4V6T5R3_DENBC|nr:hypothetical protein K435DRAFT_383100 [Dendrothele bispora CBS 962.96]
MIEYGGQTKKIDAGATSTLFYDYFEYRDMILKAYYTEVWKQIFLRKTFLKIFFTGKLSVSC